MGAARVVAAGRNPERLERALSLGADAAVELDDGLGADELRDAVRRGRRTGVLDVALDPLWGEPARAAIEALTRDGVYVSFGQAASPVAELSGIPLRNRRVTRRRPLGRLGHPAGAPGGARARPRARRAGRPRLTLDTEELALEEIGDAWERLVAGPPAAGWWSGCDDLDRDAPLPALQRRGDGAPARRAGCRARGRGRRSRAALRREQGRARPSAGSRAGRSPARRSACSPRASATCCS